MQPVLIGNSNSEASCAFIARHHLRALRALPLDSLEERPGAINFRHYGNEALYSPFPPFVPTKMVLFSMAKACAVKPQFCGNQ